jgi:hypothetical protein
MDGETQPPATYACTLGLTSTARARAQMGYVGEDEALDATLGRRTKEERIQVQSWL